MNLLLLSDKTWRLAEPFAIAGETFERLRALVVEIRDPDGNAGRSESLGVYYRDEDCATMTAQIEAVRSEIENLGASADPAGLLPPGGARNGIDAALWDLRCRQAGKPVHALMGLPGPRPVPTAFTIGISDPATAAGVAARATQYGLIKIKADADRHLETVAAVRKARPDAEIIVDANQSWDFDLLNGLAPGLVRLGVTLIEQPLPAGRDEALASYAGPLVLMADESCQDRADLPALLGRYGAINVKLDKTGGLTEAVALARAAKEHGLVTMVGNMCGGSLAMAPGLLLAQICDYADLDGPLLQSDDWPVPLTYDRGCVGPSAGDLWGGI